jgi:hypothetical protein
MRGPSEQIDLPGLRTPRRDQARAPGFLGLFEVGGGAQSLSLAGEEGPICQTGGGGTQRRFSWSAGPRGTASRSRPRHASWMAVALTIERGGCVALERTARAQSVRVAFG